MANGCAHAGRRERPALSRGPRDSLSPPMVLAMARSAKQSWLTLHPAGKTPTVPQVSASPHCAPRCCSIMATMCIAVPSSRLVLSHTCHAARLPHGLQRVTALGGAGPRRAQVVKHSGVAFTQRLLRPASPGRGPLLARPDAVQGAVSARPAPACPRACLSDGSCPYPPQACRALPPTGLFRAFQYIILFSRPSSQSNAWLSNPP